MKITNNKGFTLLEILLVIAAIGILAAIVLVAINPNRQLAQARNAERRSEVNAIYKALEQYIIDTGSYPSGINGILQNICNTGSEQVGGATNCSGSVDLRVLVPNYVASIPIDPSGSMYGVMINPNNNRISVQAGAAELNQTIAINMGPTDPNFADVVLLLPMNGLNGSAVFTDISSNSLPITRFGDAQISTAQSRWGGASGFFDGTGDYLQATVPGGLGAGDFTIEFWSYPLSTNKTFFNNRTSGTAGDGIDILADGRVTTAMSIIIFNGTTINTNQWSHVALVRSGSTITRYINGVADGSGSNSGNFNGTSFNIGGNPHPGGNTGYFNGYIDDFRVTRGVARYTSNFTPPTSAF